MSTKAETLRNPRSCLNKAEPDEPIFVLRANDPTAAQLIRMWAAMNDRLQPPEKVMESLQVAMEFDNFQNSYGNQNIGEGYPSTICRPNKVTSTKVEVTRAGTYGGGGGIGSRSSGTTCVGVGIGGGAGGPYVTPR